MGTYSRIGLGQSYMETYSRIGLDQSYMGITLVFCRIVTINFLNLCDVACRCRNALSRDLLSLGPRAGRVTAGGADRGRVSSTGVKEGVDLANSSSLRSLRLLMSKSYSLRTRSDRSTRSALGGGGEGARGAGALRAAGVMRGRVGLGARGLALVPWSMARAASSPSSAFSIFLIMPIFDGWGGGEGVRAP